MQNTREQSTQTQKYTTMTETPVKRLILKLAVPTMVSMMITSIYNMADTFFVGQIGGGEATSATAAVGVAFPLMAIIQAFGFMFGHGSGNYISRALGRQEIGDAEKMAATGFFMALSAGLLLGVLGLIFLEPLALLLGSTETILPHAKAYIGLILVGCPWMTASLVLNNQLRFQGNALFAMIGITSGGILNMLLDPLFIFAFDMGVSGAALATIISQFISFCLLYLGAWKSDNLKIRLRNFCPRPRFLLEILKGGAPSLCRQGVGSIATTCLNHAAAAFGDPAIAAMSIVSRVMTFANSLVIGFGQGFQPVCGFNYGAKKYGRVREGFRFCVKYSVIFLLLASVLGALLAPRLIALFRRDDQQVIEIGALALRLQCIMLPTFGFQMISSMMLQTSAQTLRASFLALARQGLFFIPLVLALPPLLGMTGIQLAQPLSDVISFLATLAVMLDSLKKLRQLDEEQQALAAREAGPC